MASNFIIEDRMRCTAAQIVHRWARPYQINLCECLRFLFKLVKSCSWAHHSQKWQKGWINCCLTPPLVYERLHGNNPKNRKMQDLNNW